jgi:hypothetical protein
MGKSKLQRIIIAVIDRVVRENPKASLVDFNDAIECAYPFAQADSAELRAVWRREVTSYIWLGAGAGRRNSARRLRATGAAVH